MKHAQNPKIQWVIKPAAISDNASPTSVVVDTKGYKYLKVTVGTGAMDIAMAALKLQEADATTDANTLTSGADITGCVFGTSALMGSTSTSALPSATGDDSFYVFHVPLDARRKRYIDLTATTGDGAAGTFICAWAELFDGEEVPNSSSERGVAAELIAA